MLYHINRWDDVPRRADPPPLPRVVLQETLHVLYHNDGNKNDHDDTTTTTTTNHNHYTMCVYMYIYIYIHIMCCPR